MKKIFFVLLFSSVALCCFAQEGFQFNGSNETSLFHSGLSLPLFGYDSGFTNQSSMLGNLVNSLEWGKSSFELTPYSDYRDKGFFDYLMDSPVLSGILAVLGGVAMICGFAGGVVADDSGAATGFYILGGVGVLACTIGTICIVFSL